MCAWKERAAEKAGLGQNPKEPVAWVVGGSLILADIYYNGAGVRKDVPLAMRLACELQDGAGQYALEHLAKEPSHGQEKRFEFCDYSFPTVSANFCMEYSSEIEDEHRNRYYQSLKASMTAEQSDAFDKLLSAKKVYVKAHAYEVYQGGTMRNIRTMTSQKILEDLFLSEVVRFEKKEWPKLSSSHIAKAGSLASQQYAKTGQELRKQTREQIEEGAVTASDFAKAETAWEAYRDAWAEFAHQRYPSAEAAIVAQIEMDRYRLLRTI
jgi:hypothetical protein